jgi:hypothetical protein
LKNTKDQALQVDVYKTDVNNLQAANYLASILETYSPTSNISFDMEDCDKILRIEGEHLLPAKLVIQLLAQEGFHCQELD